MYAIVVQCINDIYIYIHIYSVRDRLSITVATFVEYFVFLSNIVGFLSNIVCFFLICLVLV